MKKKVIIALAILATSGASPILATESVPVYQTINSDEDIKTLFEEGQYSKIISLYAGRPRNLSSTDLSYIALAYYRLDDIDNSLKYADLALQKDPKDLRLYTLKGVIFNTQGKYDDAIVVFQKALELSPREGELYANIGDSYMGMERYEEALANYEKATEQKKPSLRAYYTIGQAYNNMNDAPKALSAFYTAKSKTQANQELYVSVLYNIGLIEYASGNYDKALAIYDELLKYFPDDYQSYEKQIQCYYAMNNYSKGDALKAKLFELYEASLPADTSPYYQINSDFFYASSQPIYTYELYRKPTETYDKYVFYIMEINSENVDYQIIFRYDPNSASYTLIKLKDGEEDLYNLTYGSDLNYKTAKDFVIEKIK